MRLLLLTESVNWKLDPVDSYTEISPNNTYLHSEVKARKGDKLEFVTYLAFLEYTNERGLKAMATVRVELIIDSNTGIAWIDWIGTGPNRNNMVPGFDRAPGYASLRQLLAQIAKLHPQIRYFTGDRQSGMREKHPNDNQAEFKLATNRL